MKKLLAAAIAVTILGAPVAPTLADDAPRAEQSDAVALVKNAVAYYKRHGAEKAYKEYQNKNGPFVYRDLYIVVLDMSGNCVSHGDNAKMIGQNLIGLKDPDGKEYVRERIEMARSQPTGSQVFKRKNPATGEIEVRNFYYEKVGDVLIGSGSFTRIQK